MEYYQQKKVNANTCFNVETLWFQVDWNTDKMPIVPHAKFGFLLLLVLGLVLIVFSAARFRLNKFIGITFVCLYGLFMVYAFIQELYCVQEENTYC